MNSCPACQATLQPPPVGWHADGLCDRCGGVWISENTLQTALMSWRVEASFIDESPSADFCPVCGPVPLDEGTLLGQKGLSCSSCHGVFMRKPLRYERPKQEVSTETKPFATQSDSTSNLDSNLANEPLPYSVSNPINPQPKPRPPQPRPPQPRPPQPKPKPKPKPKSKSKPKSEVNTPDVNTNDIIWFVVLILAILFSLLYWMNP